MRIDQRGIAPDWLKRYFTNDMEKMSVIQLENVTFGFPGGRNLLDKASCVFQNRVINLVQGASGAGKSTLLRLINRLEEPASGNILLNGRSINSISPQSLRRSVLYIQQMPTVLDDTVRNNLLLPFNYKNNRETPKPSDERLERLMKDFLLEDVAMESNALNLSIGQRQRLCLIRGLLLEPEVVLLDEPTSALDPKSAEIVDRAAENLALSALTVIIVNHRPFETDKAEKKVWEIHNGQVLLKDDE